MTARRWELGGDLAHVSGHLGSTGVKSGGEGGLRTGVEERRLRARDAKELPEVPPVGAY
jgi:hypothetical protein